MYMGFLHFYKEKELWNCCNWFFSPSLHFSELWIYSGFGNWKKVLFAEMGESRRDWEIIYFILNMLDLREYQHIQYKIS